MHHQQEGPPYEPGPAQGFLLLKPSISLVVVSQAVGFCKTQETILIVTEAMKTKINVIELLVRFIFTVVDQANVSGIIKHNSLSYTTDMKAEVHCNISDIRCCSLKHRNQWIGLIHKPALVHQNELVKL